MEETLLNSPDTYLIALISDTERAIIDARQRELKQIGITPRQSYILRLIYNLGHDATISEIAKLVKRENHTISSQTIRMEKDGLIKRIKDKAKSTLTRFELTERGIGILPSSNKRESFTVILSCLSIDECQQLEQLLDRIKNKANDYMQK